MTFRAEAAAPPITLLFERTWMPSSPLASATVPVTSVPRKLPVTLLPSDPGSSMMPDHPKRLIAKPRIVLPAPPAQTAMPRLLSAPVLVSSMRIFALSPVASVLTAAPDWV